MRSPRVFLSGFFGFRNLGDEAILEAVVDELRRRVPKATIDASLGPDRSTAERLGITAVDFFGLDATAEAIARSDLVLFGLGGVFHDYWGASAAALFREGTNGVEAYTRPALLARMSGVPAVLFCGGVGPLRSPPGRAMFRMAGEAATLLLVRDETSASEVSALAPGAEPVIVADPAHLSSASEDDRRHCAELLATAGIAQEAVAVSVRAWDFFEGQEALAARLARALAKLPEEWPIVFVPCQWGSGTDDRAFSERIRGQLAGRATAVVEVATGGQAIALFERMALVVSARNHGIILAGCAGVPAVALCYDPKVSASAKALGLGPLALGLGEVERLPRVVDRAIGRRPEWVRAIADRRAELAARLEGAFSAVDRLLAGERTVRVGGGAPRAATSRLVDRPPSPLRGMLRALRARLQGH